MKTVRDMYRAGGMNDEYGHGGMNDKYGHGGMHEYGMSGMMKEYAKSGKMPKALLEYFKKKKKEAEMGMKMPEYQGSGFVPQIGFDMEKGVGDERFFDDPDMRLQQKVDRGLASKARRDDKRFTRDFNPIPTKDLVDMARVELREDIRNKPAMQAADRFGAGNILMLDGEYVEATPENKRKMIMNRHIEMEDGVPRDKRKNDFVQDLYSIAASENYDTYGPAKGLLVPSTGFTREELGGPLLGSSTLGTEGQSIDQQRVRGNRAAQFIEDELRKEADRMGRIYDDRYYSDEAIPGGKFYGGGRAPFRVLKRR